MCEVISKFDLWMLSSCLHFTGRFDYLPMWRSPVVLVLADVVLNPSLKASLQVYLQFWVSNFSDDYHLDIGGKVTGFAA